MAWIFEQLSRLLQIARQRTGNDAVMTCLAVTNKFCGRLWRSQMAGNLAFVQAFVTANQGATPPILSALADRCTVCLQAGGIDHHRLLLASFHSHSGRYMREDDFLPRPFSKIESNLVPSYGRCWNCGNASHVDEFRVSDEIQADHQRAAWHVSVENGI